MKSYVGNKLIIRGLLLVSSTWEENHNQIRRLTKLPLTLGWCESPV